MSGILSGVIISLSVAAVTGLVAWLGRQIVKYNKLTKQQEDEVLKKTLTDALNVQLEPIRQDIVNLKKVETVFQTRLTPVQDEIEHLKDDITEILNSLKAQGIDLTNVNERLSNIELKENHLEHETRCAWRYRIRQLCHVYIARGYMSYDEYLQLQEMYNLYAAIGGNGQTKELYEKTTKLEIKSDTEIAAISAEERGHSCPRITN